MRADALLAEHVEQVLLDPAVEQRVRRLVDQQRRAQLAQDPRRLFGARTRVGRDAGVQRLALPHRGVERAERFLERRVRIEPVRVEDVDVVEPHALQALVEAREQVLARAPLAVRARPHVVAGLGGDDQLVAVGHEVLAVQPAEVDLGRSVRRPVVVREVEVRDAEVERAAQDRALALDRPVVAEVVPEAERDRRQLEAAASAAAVRHQVVVAVVGSEVGHRITYWRISTTWLGLTGDRERGAVDLLERVVVLLGVQRHERLVQRRRHAGVERRVPLPVLLTEADDHHVGLLEQSPRADRVHARAEVVLPERLVLGTEDRHAGVVARRVVGDRTAELDVEPGLRRALLDLGAPVGVDLAGEVHLPRHGREMLPG